jgi:hypothetical protein
MAETNELDEITNALDNMAETNEVDEITNGLDDITIDTSRSEISRRTADLFVCSVCEIAHETFGQLRRHVKKAHAEDLPALRESIVELEAIPRDDMTRAQEHNLLLLRRRRGYLRRFH